MTLTRNSTKVDWLDIQNKLDWLHHKKMYFTPPVKTLKYFYLTVALRKIFYFFTLECEVAYLQTELPPHMPLFPIPLSVSLIMAIFIHKYKFHVSTKKNQRKTEVKKSFCKHVTKTEIKNSGNSFRLLP